jgi:hypothetical protein
MDPAKLRENAPRPFAIVDDSPDDGADVVVTGWGLQLTDRAVFAWCDADSGHRASVGCSPLPTARCGWPRWLAPPAWCGCNPSNPAPSRAPQTESPNRRSQMRGGARREQTGMETSRAGLASMDRGGARIIGLACGPGGGGDAGGGECEWKKRAAGAPAATPPTVQVAQMAGAAPAIVPDKPRPPKPPRKPRVRNCGKNDSDVWKNLKPVRGKKYRDNGKAGKDRRFYDWDNTHNDIEVYDHNRKHLGVMDPQTGQMYKPAVPGRELQG